MDTLEMNAGFKTIHGDYALNRGFVAASRLNLQFYLWKSSLGFNLHPLVGDLANSSGQDFCIADVATGTGIWLFDLASELPMARMAGFDIDLADVPQPPFTPKNVTFHKWDIYGDPPDRFLEAFDIVHVRLLVLVIRDSDPGPIIKNILKILKPGGWLQWDDLNYPGTHIRKPSSLASTPAFDALRTYVYSQGRHDWILDLPTRFAAYGMTQCSIHSFTDSPALTRANGDQHLMTMDEFANKLQSSGNHSESKRVRRMICEVGPEAAQGAALSMPRVVCLGRKA